MLRVFITFVANTNTNLHIHIMKMTLIAVAAAITAIGCQAATLPFNVTAPSWNKIAQCTTQGGVNIRKAPSTTAPKMVYNENSIMEEDECPVIYYGYWSTKSGGAVQSITFDGVAPVVSEQPGWVELLKQGPERKSNGWVSAKYCKVSEITPIQPSGNPKDGFFSIIDSKGADGTYAIYLHCDELNGTSCFYLGRLVDGKLVCPYFFECDYAMDTNSNAAPTINKAEYGYIFTATKQCMSEIKSDPNDEYGYYETNINMLPSNMIDFIVRQAKPFDSADPDVIYLYNGQYHLVE